MFKSSKITTLICGLIVIAVTVVGYMLAFDDIFEETMIWLSLLFLISAEIIATVKAMGTKSFFGVAGVVTSVFHIGVVLLLSIIYLIVDMSLIRTYVLLNILALCIMLAVDVTILHFGGHVKASNKALSDSRSVIDTLCEKAKAMSLEYQESEYKKELVEICEMLQYSDNTALSNDEVQILDKMEELQSLLAQSDEKIPQKITEIKNSIKMRSLKIASTKRGSY